MLTLLFCSMLCCPYPPALLHPPQALPSLAEVMYSQFKAKKEALQHQNKDDVLAKYGNTGG